MIIENKKEEKRVLIFGGRPEDFKEACKKLSKTDLLEAIKTLERWKGSAERAERFLEETNKQIRDLEGKLWEEVVEDHSEQFKSWPVCKILKPDGNNLWMVNAYRTGEISLEEVKIDG